MQAFSPQVRLNPGTMGKKIVRICCAHQRFAIFSFFSLRLQQDYNLHYNGITVNGLWRFILLFSPSLTWHPSAGPESMLRNALSAMAGRERGWTRSEHKVKKKTAKNINVQSRCTHVRESESRRVNVFLKKAWGRRKRKFQYIHQFRLFFSPLIRRFSASIKKISIRLFLSPPHRNNAKSAFQSRKPYLNPFFVLNEKRFRGNSTLCIQRYWY